MINVKLWGSRLYGKESARAFRLKFASSIRPNEVTLFNMAGVKDVTPGFIYDAFGPLYELAKDREGSIKFENTPKHLQPIILSAMKAYVKK